MDSTMKINRTLDELRQYTLTTGRRMLDKYGFDDWKVAIDTRPRDGRWGRSGQCRYDRNEIGISLCLLNSQSKQSGDNTFLVKQVVVHEIAHALAPESHHWLLWKQQYARLLWAEFGGNANLVEGGLLWDRYCRERSSELLEFAKTHQNEPITVLAPKKKVAVRRTFPEATRQVFSLERDYVDPFWIMSEGPKTFLCAEVDDRCGEGKLRRFRKGDVFLDADKARQAILNDIDREIERFSQYLPEDDPEKHEMAIEIIQQRQARKLEILGSAS
ncbi:MAG: hypothetical protein R3C59_21195 [Planctomycetaceae bacterium]